MTTGARNTRDAASYKAPWQKLDEAEFVRAIRDELNARGWELREGPDGGLTGKPPAPAGSDVDGVALYPHNFYLQYQKGEPLAGIIDKIAGAVSLVESLPSWEEAQGRLTLQLREPLRLTAPDGREVDVVEEPSRLPGLVLALSLDFPDHIAGVTQRILERWGVTREEALALARAQTLAKLPAWEQSEVDGHRYWVAADGNGYAATAIALAESVDLIPVSPRRLWLAAPSRDVALAFEGDSPESDRFIAFAALYVVKEHNEADHARSRYLYRVNEGGRVEVAGFGELPRSKTLL